MEYEFCLPCLVREITLASVSSFRMRWIDLSVMPIERARFLTVVWWSRCRHSMTWRWFVRNVQLLLALFLEEFSVGFMVFSSYDFKYMKNKSCFMLRVICFVF